MPGIVTTERSGFVARFHPDPARRAAFEAAFDKLWRPALDFMNAQCNFVFYGWDRGDEWFYTIESYKDEDMLDQLRASPEFQSGVAGLLALCDRPMEFTLLRGMDCDRSIFDKYEAGPSRYHPRAGDICVMIS